MHIRRVITVGNALYINIPKEVAEELDIRRDDKVIIVVVNGTIIVKKINREVVQ